METVEVTVSACFFKLTCGDMNKDFTLYMERLTGGEDLSKASNTLGRVPALVSLQAIVRQSHTIIEIRFPRRSVPRDDIKILKLQI